MKKGDKLQVYPSVPSGDGIYPEPVDAVVVYVHPKMRFFVVRWLVKYDEPRTEVLYFPPRCGNVCQYIEPPQKIKRQKPKKRKAE